MGNRAIITLEDSPNAAGLYLHWNGGVESILGFLAAAKELGVRAPGVDSPYFLARFAQIVGNFFGGNASVGFGLLKDLPDGEWCDNGTYVLGGDFHIVKRSMGDQYTVYDLDDEQLKKYQGVRKDAIDASQNFFFKG